MKKPEWSGELCYSCEVELTEENTASHKGFDESNFNASETYGGNPDKSPFIKCDNCFDADIDRYLEHLYE